MFRVFKTIRGKLTLYFILIFGITLVIFSTVLYSIFSGQIKDDFDLVMTAFAASISETIKEDGVTSDILLEINETNTPGLTHYNGYVMVLNSSETIVLRSRQIEDANIMLDRDLVNSSLNGRKEFATETVLSQNNLWDENGIRILYYPALHHGHKYSLILISPLARQVQTLSSLKLILFISVPVTLFLAGFVGWFFSRQAYQPVSQLVEKTNTITAERLYERLTVDEVDDEISRLAGTLNNMIERLETSFKVLKQFTSDASHELKTPLTIMKGEIEVALKKSRSADEYREILEVSLEEVNRLQNIVESLLMLSQYENKKIILNYEKVDINELLVEAVAKSKYISAKKNIKLILHLSEADSLPCIIKGDPKKLLNVFLNLIENAAKYSEENTEINLNTSVDETKHECIVTISDQGLGIEKDKLEQIFERFYRVDSSRTRSEDYSMGLGLSISRAAIEAHGGRITASSKIGSGSVFTIFLPLSAS